MVELLAPDVVEHNVDDTRVSVELSVLAVDHSPLAGGFKDLWKFLEEVLELTDMRTEASTTGFVPWEVVLVKDENAVSFLCQGPGGNGSRGSGSADDGIIDFGHIIEGGSMFYFNLIMGLLAFFAYFQPSYGQGNGTTLSILRALDLKSVPEDATI